MAGLAAGPSSGGGLCGDSARSVGLTATQKLIMIPIFYRSVGAVVTHGTDENMAYAGVLMAPTICSSVDAYQR